jgi:hypothetical protein
VARTPPVLTSTVNPRGNQRRGSLDMAKR